MLKGFGSLAAMAVTAVALLATPTQAQQGAMNMEMPKGTVRTISGTVIDVSCKFGQGLAGADHKMCAGICADRGLPLAVLGDDGKLYLAISAGMPGDAQNARLKEFAEAKVRVTGKVFVAGGASAIEIEKITLAAN
jgi:hypothetical protein